MEYDLFVVPGIFWKFKSQFVNHSNKGKKLRKPIFLFIFTVFISIGGVIFAQSNEDCLTCHSDNELTMEKNGKEISLFVNESVLNKSTHRQLKCISCHKGFSADDLPHKENIQPINCTMCHKDAAAKHLFHPQMLQDKGTGKSADLNCKGCHGTHDVMPTKTSGAFGGKESIAACVKCHKEANDAFVQSDHYNALIQGVKGSPTCVSCHKTQITNAEGRDLLQVKREQEKLCLSCHLDNPDVRNKIPNSAAFINTYEHSVHGIALANGKKESANCVDCHGYHTIAKGNNPKSSVAKINVPQTCGKCHEKITREYNESVHGLAVKNKNFDSPVCTDCHGEHNISDPQAPNSPLAFQNVSEKICSPCHSSVRLSERYGLAADRYSTFAESYHGLALRGGSATVANCGSCHGVHNIKSSSDPTSTVHKDNLVATCGSCHPGANENFTKGKIHVDYSDKENEPLLYWISNIYIILILVTIGFMLIHNMFDLYRKAKVKLLIRRGVIQHKKHGHNLYLRMTKSERIQHVSLMISFFTLVITGFMLRFPDAWWVRHIRDFIPDAFDWRSLIHRIAGVVMVAASLYHMFYLMFTQRGRQLFYDMLPRLKDAADAVMNLKYNFGFSKEKPRFGRFSYIEKVEYFALIWGTVVMTITGFVMWFDNTFIGLFTKLGWDVARLIHYYEAWLAFLAIVVWHIYYVIFNPDSYPMNLAWIKGTLTEEEMADDHPLELEEILAQRENEEEKEENKA